MGNKIRTTGTQSIRRLLQLAALCVAVLLAAAQAGAAEYRGDVDLSEITDDEWGMIRDAEMPREKIRQVLNHNVTITEYFRYPWLRLGMSEKQYLEARRQGRLTRDNPDLRRSSESQHQWAVVHNFFLPGLHQFKRGQNQKAGMMAGGAVLGAGLFALALTRDYGDIAPLSLLIMIPSMAWSSVDIGMQIHREQNPEASRFSAADTESTSHAVSLRFSVPWR